MFSYGLPADFYIFSGYMKNILLTKSINYAMKIGELSIEQKRGIITLSPPPQKKIIRIDFSLKSGDQLVI